MARPTQFQKLSLQLDAENKRLKAKLSKTKKDIFGVGKAAKSIGPMIAGAFAVSSIIGFGREIISLTSEYGFMMSRVQALTGASDELTKKLSEQAQMLGKTTQFTAKQAAEAMTFLAQAGLKVNQIYKAMPGTLQLAAAGNIQLAEAADIATNVMSAYGLQAKDLGRVNDVIANTTTNANTNVLEFAEAFKMVGPIAKSANIPIEVISANIGILANSGIKGTMAGTQLRAMISKLVNPSGEAAKVLKRLGIETLNVDGSMRPLNDIMKEMAMKGTSLSEVFKVFDNRAAAAALVLERASPTFDSFVETVSKTGTAAEIAAKQMDNLRGDSLKLTSAWQGLMLTFGESGDTIIRSFTKALTNDIQRLSDLVEGITPRFRRWRDSVKEMDLSSEQLESQIALLTEKVEESQAAFDEMEPTRNDKQFKDARKNLESYKQQLEFLNSELLVSKSAQGGNTEKTKEELEALAELARIAELAALRKKVLTEQTNKLAEAAEKSASAFRIEAEATIANFETFSGAEKLGDIFSDVETPVHLDDLSSSVDAITDGFTMMDEEAEEFIDTVGMLREQVTESFMDVAGIIGRVANGIANAKDNWAAMGATVISGAIQMVGKINEIRELTQTAAKANMAASQAEGVAGAVKAGAGIPFPGNLLAIATGVATVLSTIAPFIGSFAKGIDFVPQTGLAMIHKGEAVIPAGENMRGKEQLVAVVSGSDLHFILDEFSRKRGNSF